MVHIYPRQKSPLSGKRAPAFSLRLLYVARIPCVEERLSKGRFSSPFFSIFSIVDLSAFLLYILQYMDQQQPAVPSSWTTSPFLAAKELVANIQEKRALSTKKGSPGTFSKFQGRAEPLMRLLLLCLFPLNSQLPCQEWHFSIASSKKVHLESSRGAQQRYRNIFTYVLANVTGRNLLRQNTF